MGVDRLSAPAEPRDRIETEEPSVPLLEDLLLRFRRVWAPPGPVTGQPGVPADLVAELDDEVRDLSIELAAIAREGEGIVQAAESQARSIIDSARTQAVRMVETARIAAPAVRMQNASAKLRDRRSEIERVIADAEADAAVIRRRGSSRMEHVVDRVVADVFAGQPAEEQHARVVGGG